MPLQRHGRRLVGGALLVPHIESAAGRLDANMRVEQRVRALKPHLRNNNNEGRQAWQSTKLPPLAAKAEQAPTAVEGNIHQTGLCVFYWADFPHVPSTHRLDKWVAGRLPPALMAVQQGSREVVRAAAGREQLAGAAGQGAEAGQRAMDRILGACKAVGSR